MLKISDLKKSTQHTIERIAKASNMKAETVLRIMLNPNYGKMVTTHLNYGLDRRK